MSNIDKIKKECKKLNLNINYSSSNWKQKFIEKVNWNDISWNQDLSEEFIEYFKDNVYWGDISLHQVLSEEFIEYFKDNVNWNYISLKQDLSESFIEKYKDKIDFEYLFHNRNLTNELILNNIQWFINEDIKYSWRFEEDKEFEDKWNKYKKLFGS